MDFPVELLKSALERFGGVVHSFEKRASLRNHKNVIRAKRDAMLKAADEYMYLVSTELHPDRFHSQPAAQAYLDVVDWDIVEKEGYRIFGKVVLDIIQAAGVTLTPSQRNAAFRKARIDPIGDAAVKWAKKHSSTLITDVTGKTKAGIRTIIASAIDEGQDLFITRSQLSGMVGLTDAQTGKGLKIFNKALADGRTREAALKEMEAYSKRALRFREELIAQTETAAASAQGILAAFEENAVEKSEWVADLGPGCCEICQERNGKIYLLEEADGMLPAHPGCECAWVIAR